MIMLDDMLADPDHFMHGTSKGWQLGCRCRRCSEAAKAILLTDDGSKSHRDTIHRARKRWSREEDAVVDRMRKDGCSVSEIAAKLDRSAASVKDHMVRLRKHGAAVASKAFLKDMHGTYSSYVSGCRCAECKRAMFAYHLKLKDCTKESA